MYQEFIFSFALCDLDNLFVDQFLLTFLEEKPRKRKSFEV